MEESGWIKITDIKPHPENSRNHDDKQIKKISLIQITSCFI